MIENSIKEIIMQDPFYCLHVEGVLLTYNIDNLNIFLSTFKPNQNKQEYSNLIFDTYNAFVEMTKENKNKDYHIFLINKRISNFLIYTLEKYGPVLNSNGRIYLSSEERYDDNGNVITIKTIIKE